MLSAFNLLVFPNSMFTQFFFCFFFNDRAMCSLEKWHLEITIIKYGKCYVLVLNASNVNNQIPFDKLNDLRVSHA